MHAERIWAINFLVKIFFTPISADGETTVQNKGHVFHAHRQNLDSKTFRKYHFSAATLG